MPCQLYKTDSQEAAAVTKNRKIESSLLLMQSRVITPTHLRDLAPRQLLCFEEASLWSRAVGDTASDLGIEFRPPTNFRFLNYRHDRPLISFCCSHISQKYLT